MVFWDLAKIGPKIDFLTYIVPLENLCKNYVLIMYSSEVSTLALKSHYKCVFKPVYGQIRPNIAHRQTCNGTSEHTYCVYQLQTIVKKKFQKRFRFFCVKHLLCENLVILVSWMHWKLVVVLYFNIQPSIVLKRGREFFFRVMFKMASWFGCEPPFFSFFSHCQTCQRHPKQVKSRKKHRRLKINNLRHKRRLCLHQLILMHFCKR